MYLSHWRICLKFRSMMNDHCRNGLGGQARRDYDSFRTPEKHLVSVKFGCISFDAPISTGKKTGVESVPLFIS